MISPGCAKENGSADHSKRRVDRSPVIALRAGRETYQPTPTDVVAGTNRDDKEMRYQMFILHAMVTIPRHELAVTLTTQKKASATEMKRENK